MIIAKDISYHFGKHPVLDGVGLSTKPKTVIGLIGPNGSGKSTLLRCLYGSLKSKCGVVMVDNKPLHEWAIRDIAKYISVVPQESAGAFALTVAEAVLMGRTPHRKDHQSYTREDKQIVAEVLHQVGAIHLLERRLAELSGGERQRVAIARCLAQRTEILLLDEPTNHLDIRYQHEVLKLVKSLNMATVVVLHDLNLAAKYCDELILLHKRKIACAGTIHEVLREDVLEQVYEISVRRIAHHNGIFLDFY